MAKYTVYDAMSALRKTVRHSARRPAIAATGSHAVIDRRGVFRPEPKIQASRQPLSFNLRICFTGTLSSPKTVSTPFSDTFSQGIGLRKRTHGSRVPVSARASEPRNSSFAVSLQRFRTGGQECIAIAPYFLRGCTIVQHDLGHQVGVLLAPGISDWEQEAFCATRLRLLTSSADAVATSGVSSAILRALPIGPSERSACGCKIDWGNVKPARGKLRADCIAHANVRGDNGLGTLWPLPSLSLPAARDLSYLGFRIGASVC
ncbi:hypothetical protein C8F04DRAFT_1178448 [Mycena alexandri]|uniref:Uncharacterized protein n=1 Tax=Mycena alexandri TaxID=1745969 RepID=A0AAD6T4N3_9AGAR|nr:hypothetical protein C8F04DRAFT_1178448 [Mycena alexandri]